MSDIDWNEFERCLKDCVAVGTWTRLTNDADKYVFSFDASVGVSTLPLGDTDVSLEWIERRGEEQQRVWVGVTHEGG